jgi:hypothetical protein
MRANRRDLAARLVLLVLVASLLATAFAGWKWQKGSASAAPAHAHVDAAV